MRFHINNDDSSIENDDSSINIEESSIESDDSSLESDDSSINIEESSIESDDSSLESDDSSLENDDSCNSCQQIRSAKRHRCLFVFNMIYAIFQNDEFCINNDGLCKMMNLALTMMDFVK